MHLASSLIVLIVFSLLVTLLLAPLQRRLMARGMRSSVALLICLGTYIVVLGLAALIVVIGLADFVANLPTYRSALEVQLSRLFAPSELLASALTALSDIAQSLVATVGSGVVTIGYSVIVVA